LDQALEDPLDSTQEVQYRAREDLHLDLALEDPHLDQVLEDPLDSTQEVQEVTAIRCQVELTSARLLEQRMAVCVS